VAEVSLDQVYVRSERMVGRPVAEEYVLVPIAREAAELENIFSLNRVAAFIWGRVDGQTPGRDIVAAMTERFDVEAGRAEGDYLAFLSELLALGAVFESPSAGR
jgi:hypothetical protein